MNSLSASLQNLQQSEDEELIKGSCWDDGLISNFVNCLIFDFG